MTQTRPEQTDYETLPAFLARYEIVDVWSKVDEDEHSHQYAWYRAEVVGFNGRNKLYVK